MKSGNQRSGGANTTLILISTSA
uniref:Uncharacterized protein n=1 Tax=Anguilla anguilla TaxID=7936 RepID=A0A0E9UEP5_ANGAN